jgi:hypothetical protein
MACVMPWYQNVLKGSPFPPPNLFSFLALRLPS